MVRNSNPNAYVPSSAPITQEENNNMVAFNNYAFDNARVYGARNQKPSVHLTEDQINALTVRTPFERLVRDGRIGITRAANASRKEAIPVIFSNIVQMNQLGRALAYVEHNIHAVQSTHFDTETHLIVLIDMQGDNDRIAVGRRSDGDGRVCYTAHYANKIYNDFGQLADITAGDVHPIGVAIAESVAKQNAQVDEYNAAILATAQGIATDQQRTAIGGLAVGDNPNRFVQENSRRHINGDTIVNKYMLESLLLLAATNPAFEIHTWSKNEEALGRHMDTMVRMMEYAYKSELRKLAGLVKFEERNAE